MSNRQFALILCAYLAGGILTFGYAANAEVDEGRRGEGEYRVMTGIMCGMAWPLYLSYVTFKGARK